MSTSMSATLAYGVSIGTEEVPLVGPKDEEYGGLAEEWLIAHGLNANDPEKDLGDVLLEAISAAAGWTREEPSYDSDAWSLWADERRAALELFGVELEFNGGTSSPGHLLLIKETANRVDWTEVFRLDPRALLAREAAGEVVAWGQKLNEILEAAGLTPDEDNAPGWLVFAECSGDH